MLFSSLETIRQLLKTIYHRLSQHSRVYSLYREDLFESVERIRERLAVYEAAGVQELVIHFSDATHLEMVRQFGRTFIGETGRLEIRLLTRLRDEQRFSLR